MIDVFLNGGLVTMSILTVLFILVLIASKYRNHLIRPIGIIAFIFGVLSAVLGLYSAFIVIEQVGNPSPSILAGGIKTAFIAVIYSLIILVVALILDLMNSLKS